MSLEERTGFRDMTFSKWHRTLPADCTWIDIDCCQFCHYCGSLLAVFELVRSPDEDSLLDVCLRKQSAITERVGLQLGIPAFKVAYTGDPLDAAAVIELGTNRKHLMFADELGEFINGLHDCNFCRRHRGGRFATQGANHDH